MAKSKEPNVEPPEDIEELVYETRFLLNVLIDLLAEKKVITEDELFSKYDKIFKEAEKNK